MTKHESAGREDVPLAPKPQDALETALDAARLADPIVSMADGRTLMVLPDGHHHADISDPHALPPRPQQKLTVNDRDSLINYANRHKSADTALVADFDLMAMTAYLDWHPDNDAKSFGQAGSLQHRATFKLLPSEEFRRWDAFEGKLHAQDVFAAFLEENSVDITHPEAAVMIEISRDLEATTQTGYKSSTRLENGDRSFRFESDTKVKNDVVVPRDFTLTIPLYNGEDPVDLRAALRWRPTGEGINFGFEWRRVEYQRRAYFQEIATRVSEETGIAVYFGRTGG